VLIPAALCMCMDRVGILDTYLRPHVSDNPFPSQFHIRRRTVRCLGQTMYQILPLATRFLSAQRNINSAKLSPTAVQYPPSPHSTPAAIVSPLARSTAHTQSGLNILAVSLSNPDPPGIRLHTVVGSAYARSSNTLAPTSGQSSLPAHTNMSSLSVADERHVRG
jgi:hypothetical protein